jgi:hypothetical protein
LNLCGPDFRNWFLAVVTSRFDKMPKSKAFNSELSKNRLQRHFNGVHLITARIKFSKVNFDFICNFYGFYRTSRPRRLLVKQFVCFSSLHTAREIINDRDSRPAAKTVGISGIKRNNFSRKIATSLTRWIVSVKTSSDPMKRQ